MNYFLAVNRLNEHAAADLLGPAIRAHLEWTMRMIKEGNCLQAGRWGERGGMAILKAADMEEAKRMLDEDPLIRSGMVTFSLERFYPDIPFADSPAQ